MDIREAIYTRRAVREFTSEPVSESIIRDLIDAAVQAPSAVNQQPWTFCVIRDKNVLATSRSLLCSARTVGWIARANRKRRERAARSYFLEAIADTIERLDHIELDVACPELYAQPLDVAVDGPVVDIHLIVVGCIHQGVAAFHHSRPARERLQDEKLGDGERDKLVFPGAGMPLRIHT
jgi:hypothetical protein